MELLKRPGMTALTVTSFIALAACRTGLRPQAVSGDPVAVDIHVVGMSDADWNRPELVYTLTGCGNENTSGTKTEGKMLNFMTQNVRKDDRCDLQIMGNKNDASVGSWFEADGLMYNARRIIISSDQGKLSGRAFVQQLYAKPSTDPTKPQVTAWQLATTLKGPKAFSGICTCLIGCLPALPNNVAKLEIGTLPTSGSCAFANVIKSDASRIECSKMTVQCGTDFFVGQWPAGSVVDGSATKSQSLPELAMTQGIPEAISDTTIEVVLPK
jgi:hypothetical protein